MNLDDAQKDKVRQWVTAGLQPAEIQKRLAEELGVKLTYMEVRFLLADLDLKLKDKDVAPAVPPTVQGSPGASGRNAELKSPSPPEDFPDAGGPGGGVKVAVDQLTRPGSIVSGRVTFSDGQSAEWYLDQMGRLGLAPKQKGYKPSQRDVMEFQTLLQNELARLGY